VYANLTFIRKWSAIEQDPIGADRELEAELAVIIG
jgi:hypothetical protein